MRITLLVLTLFTLFVGVTPVFAISVTISNVPSEITDQPFNIDVTVSGAQAGTNYLRANLFPHGTTKYFGFTNNGTSFINSSDYYQYFPITIAQSGNWTGSIQAKLDPDSSYFSGPGAYSLKVRRYTQSGSSYTWSNEVTLAVNFTTPTPTPTPSPTPNPTPSPTPSPTPTALPTPSNNSSTSKTKTSNVTKTPSPTLSPTTPIPSAQDIAITSFPEKSLARKIEYRIASVAAVTTSASPSAKLEVKSQKQTNYFFWAGLILIFAGISSIGYIYLRKNANTHIRLRKRY